MFKGLFGDINGASRFVLSESTRCREAGPEAIDKIIVDFVNNDDFRDILTALEKTEWETIPSE